MCYFYCGIIKFMFIFVCFMLGDGELSDFGFDMVLSFIGMNFFFDYMDLDEFLFV